MRIKSFLVILIIMLSILLNDMKIHSGEQSNSQSYYDFIISLNPRTSYNGFKSFLEKLFDHSSLNTDIDNFLSDIENQLEMKLYDDDIVTYYNIDPKKNISIAAKIDNNLLHYIFKIPVLDGKKLTDQLNLLYKKFSSKNESLVQVILDYLYIPTLTGGWKDFITYYKANFYYSEYKNNIYISTYKNIKEIVTNEKEAFPLKDEENKVIYQNNDSSIFLFLKPTMLSSFIGKNIDINNFINFIYVKIQLTELSANIKLEVAFNQYQSAITDILSIISSINNNSNYKYFKNRPIVSFELQAPIINEIIQFLRSYYIINFYLDVFNYFDEFGIISNIEDTINMYIFNYNSVVKYPFHIKNLKTVKMLLGCKLKNTSITENKIATYLSNLSQLKSFTSDKFKLVKMDNKFYHQYNSPEDEVELMFGIDDKFFYYSNDITIFKDFITAKHKNQNVIVDNESTNGSIFLNLRVNLYEAFSKLKTDNIFKRMNMKISNLSELKLFDNIDGNIYSITCNISLK